MIEEKKGNLLEATDCEAIVHQTNCLGVMGGGIARQIKSKWYETIYMPYKMLCMDNIGTKQLLGTIQPLPTKDEGSNIEYAINAFGEYSFSEADSSFPDGRATDYDALRNCFELTKEWCKENDIKTIGMPKNIGCGLAGGDWDGVVYPMIKEMFEDCNELTVRIYEFNPRWF